MGSDRSVDAKTARPRDLPSVRLAGTVRIRKAGDLAARCRVDVDIARALSDGKGSTPQRTVPATRKAAPDL
jgi:hypothetical protein